MMPFYPSPLGDDGYDITDYYAVDPRFGTLGDFVEMIRTADNLGIRVLVDLVMSHTSNQHPWFQRSRHDRDSRYRDYYRWSDTKQEEPRDVAFPGEQTSTWTYDDVAGQWYMHRYYDFMPDLNITDPDVLDEMHKVLGFWLELGISGGSRPVTCAALDGELPHSAAASASAANTAPKARRCSLRVTLTLRAVRADRCPVRADTAHGPHILQALVMAYPPSDPRMTRRPTSGIQDRGRYKNHFPERGGCVPSLMVVPFSWVLALDALMHG